MATPPPVLRFYGKPAERVTNRSDRALSYPAPAHLDCVREGDGHLAEADIGQHIAQHMDDGQRVD